MKLLFVLSHGAYLRNFGMVIEALAERGHQVDFAFSGARKGDLARFEEIFGDNSNVTLVEPPSRAGWWWAAADPLRAVRDYVHYLHPAFDDAPKLVERSGRRVPAVLRRCIGFRGGNQERRRALLDKAMALIERSIPPDPGSRGWLQQHRPDALIVSPLVDFDYHQLDLLKAAAGLGIPTVHLVASWDNLSNKGRIQMTANGIVVWNEFQQAEAERLHGIEPGRVTVTGAQLHDHWFAMEPTSREEFCRRAGLADPATPFILYAGSSSFICPDEGGFLRSWATAIRDHADPALRQAQILVRPHPLNAAQWQDFDASGLDPLVIWPRAGETPIGQAAKQDYYDSLFHAAAVVGINTSTFLEAAIVGRRIYTVAGSGFDGGQTGTLHFRYLTEGGLIEVAPDMEAHLASLASAVRSDASAQGQFRGFLEKFLRPGGLEEPALPNVVAAIESVAVMRPRHLNREGATAPLIRFLLMPFAATYLRPRYLAKLKIKDSSQA